MSTPTWVVIGEASRRPVAIFYDLGELVIWLKTRRGTSQLRVYAIGGSMEPGKFTVVRVKVKELIQ